MFQALEQPGFLMKGKSIVFGSLLLNVLLTIVLVHSLQNRPLPGDSLASRALAARSPNHSTPESTPPPPAANAAAPFDWRVVESADYRKYVANLRAIGCPEETIRDIIIADVNKLFETRRQELQQGRPKFQYWKAGNPLAAVVDPAIMEKQKLLNQEKRDLLKEILGVAPDDKNEPVVAWANPLDNLLDFLSPAKRAQVQEVMQQQQSKLVKLASGSGTMDSEDIKKLQTLHREGELELAKILTPAELEDYQLRWSQTSMMLRHSLSGFDPSEEEFRTIFKMRKPIDDAFTVFNDSADPDSAQRRAEAEAKLKESLRQVLGDARYADYERSQDYQYQQIAKVADRQGVSKEDTIRAYDMAHTAQLEVFRLQADDSLGSEQRQRAIDAIRAESERSLRQALGEQAFDAYRRQPNAAWLRGSP